MEPTLYPEHEAYVAEYWDVIAAIGWKEYTAHGRGAMLVQNFGQPDENTIYIPLKMLGVPLTAAYANVVAAYDPSRETVVIVVRSPDSIGAYKGAVPGRATPPQAYERLNAKLFAADCHIWSTICSLR